MPNPFSGLENIGQSYLAGLQIANQRQAQQEAITQRQEDSRIRGQYYQDLVDQRRDAAAAVAQGRTDELTRRTAADLLAGKQRDDTLSLKFGSSLVRNKDGSIDLIGSADKLEKAEGRKALAETAGLAEALGMPLDGIDEKMRGTKAYQNGLKTGIVEKMKNETQFARVLASQGILPAPPQALPAGLESTISGPSQDTELNVLNEISQAKTVPETLVQPPARTAAEDIPKGYQLRRIGGGRTVLMKLPKTEKVNVDRPYTVNILDDGGKILETIKMSAEERDAYKARQLSQPPAATNAVPIFRVIGGAGNRSVQR